MPLSLVAQDVKSIVRFSAESGRIKTRQRVSLSMLLERGTRWGALVFCRLLKVWCQRFLNLTIARV